MLSSSVKSFFFSWYFSSRKLSSKYYLQPGSLEMEWFSVTQLVGLPDSSGLWQAASAWHGSGVGCDTAPLLFVNSWVCWWALRFIYCLGKKKGWAVLITKKYRPPQREGKRKEEQLKFLSGTIQQPTRIAYHKDVAWYSLRTCAAASQA